MSKTNYIDLIIFPSPKKGWWGLLYDRYTRIARDPSALLWEGGPVVHEQGATNRRRCKIILDTRCRDRGATYRAPLSVGYSNNLIECYQLSCKLTYMKTKKQIEKINISMKWEELLPMYASIYSSLNETGKLQVQKELKIVGAKIDRLNK